MAKFRDATNSGGSRILDQGGEISKIQAKAANTL